MIKNCISELHFKCFSKVEHQEVLGRQFSMFGPCRNQLYGLSIKHLPQHIWLGKLKWVLLNSNPTGVKALQLLAQDILKISVES